MEHNEEMTWQALDTDDSNSLSCDELCVGIRKLVLHCFRTNSFSYPIILVLRS
jgi:hypothetical protein